MTPATAQTVHFSGPGSPLGSGFSGPFAVALDRNGNVFVADFYNNAVKEIVAGTGGAAAGTVNSSSTVNTLGSGFSYPTGVALDVFGDVFVADSGSGAVKEIVAGTGGAAAGTVNSSSTVNPVGRLGSPFGVAVDGNGNVFVVENFEGGGVYQILAGTGGAAAGTVNSSSTVNTVHTGFVSATGVAVDGYGDVFVADDGYNAVYEILANPCNCPAGTLDWTTSTVNAVGGVFNSPVGVAADAFGDVFVADNSNNAVYEIGTNGAGLDGSITNTLLNGFNGPIGVAVDGSGNVFVADVYNNTVKELVAGGDFGPVNVGSSSAFSATLNFAFDTGGAIGTPAVLTQGAAGLDFTDAGTGTCTTNGTGHTYSTGDTCTVNVTFKPKAPGQRYGAVVLYDTASPANLLATGYVQRTGVGPLAVFYPGVQSTVPDSTLSGTNGPIGVAVDALGNLYVSVWYPQAVVKETLSGGSYTQSALGGSIWGRPGGGMAVDGAGNVYVADTDKGVVKVPVTDSTCAIPGDCISIGSGLSEPFGVAVDGSGNVYIADTGNNRVLLETLANGVYGQSEFYVKDGLNSPRGVAVDGSGNVYIADTGNNRVLKETLTGGAYTDSVTGGGYTESVIASGLAGPQQVVVDGSGNVYIADTGDGTVLLTVLEEFDTGPAYIQSTIVSGLSQPTGVAVDSSGNVFVGDSNSDVVIKLDVSDLPSLSFASTNDDSASSVQSVTVQNIGNTWLSTVSPGLVITGHFAQVAGSGTPTDCTTSFSMAAGKACNLSLEFQPVSPDNGPVSGSVILTDNNLNASPGTTQTIQLSGTGTIGPASMLAFTTPPTATIAAGDSPGPVLVSVEDASGNVEPTSSDSITLTVTGPNGYSQTYGPTAASSGVASFGSLAALIADGSYTYTATDTPDSLTQAVADETVAVTYSNVGTAGPTQTATLLFMASGTLNTIGVLTQGAADLDFQLASGGTCATGTGYTAGQTCTVNYTFNPLRPGPRYGSVELIDSSGNLLATGYVQGTGVGPLAAFYPAVQSTIGAGGWGYAAGIAADSSGNVYLVDQGHNQVLKETPAGGAYTPSIVADSTPAYGLNSPTDVAVDGAGNVYIADDGNGRVVKETLSGGTYTQSIVVNTGTYALTVDGSGNVYFPNDTYVVKETLSNGSYTPSNIGSGLYIARGSVKVDGAGNLYIGDQYDHKVVKETLSGGSYAQSVIATGFYWGNSIALDAAGDVYVADQGTGILYMESPSGGSYTQSTLATNLSGPIFMTIDGSGNLYISNSNADQFIKLDVSDSPSFSFATTTVGSQSSDSPQTVTLENDGNAALTFSIPTTGSNPSIATNFTLNSSGETACPLVSAGSSTAGTLASGSACTLPISFEPTAVGTLSGSLILADNNLNGVNATQSITLSGTAMKASQTITFAALPTQTYGAAPFTVSATASSGLPVSFASITPSICTVSGTTVTVVGGQSNCTIRATQAGNADYLAAPAVTRSSYVNRKGQAITFPTIPTTPLSAGSVNLSATTSSGLPVSFASTTSSVCAVSGTTATLVSAGTCTIQATQAGNSNYLAAGSVSRSFKVTQAAQTITFTALPTLTYGETGVTLSATASSGLAVSFTSMTPSICTVSGTTVTVVGGQSICTIRATQAGNADYLAAPAVTCNSYVNRKGQAITFPTIPTTPLSAETVNLSATASSGIPVNYASTTSSVCTVSGTTTTLVSSGTCTIQATQAGNSDYLAAASVSRSFKVTAN